MAIDLVAIVAGFALAIASVAMVALAMVEVPAFAILAAAILVVAIMLILALVIHVSIGDLVLSVHLSHPLVLHGCAVPM